MGAFWGVGSGAVSGPSNLGTELSQAGRVNIYEYTRGVNGVKRNVTFRREEGIPSRMVTLSVPIWIPEVADSCPLQKREKLTPWTLEESKRAARELLKKATRQRYELVDHEDNSWFNELLL